MKRIRECVRYFSDRNDAILEARKREKSDGVTLIAYRERHGKSGYRRESLITSKSGRLFIVSVEHVDNMWVLKVEKAGYDEMSKEKWDVCFATID